MDHDRSLQMLSYVPDYYRESRIYNAQNSAKGQEFDILRTMMDSFEEQLTPQTATWGLCFWEEMCGLPVILSEDIGVRRSKVLSILTTASPITKKVMARIILISTGAIARFENTVVPHVVNAIVTDFSTVTNVLIICPILDDVAPCHIQFNIFGEYTERLDGGTYYAAVMNECIHEVFQEVTE